MGIMPESGKEMLPGNVELLETIGTKRGKIFMSFRVGLWMLRPCAVPPPHLVRYPSDEQWRITDGRAADVESNQGGCSSQIRFSHRPVLLR